MDFYEPSPEALRLNPMDLASGSIESGTYRLLLDQGALDPAFFDLSSGFAGDLLQKLSNYGIRMAVVVPDPAIHSRSFQEFALEANRRGPVRFFPERELAVAWLTGPG